MNSEIKRKDVTALIENIKKHSDRLTEYDEIPLLELSAILSKINRLHESTVVLKYLVAKESHKEDKIFSETGYFYPSNKSEDTKEASKYVKDFKVEEAQENVFPINEQIVSGELAEDEEIVVEIEVDEEDVESTDLTDGEEIMVEMEVDEEDVESTELEEGEEIVVEIEVEQDESEDVQVQDLVSEEEVNIDESEEINIEEVIQTLESEELGNLPDLNEQYAGEDDNSLSEQLQKQPIADLVSAIGLNERYLYANELFEGDLDLFKDALTKINEFDELSEAKTFFWDELSSKYNWEKDNPMTVALYNLVERRFV